MLVLAVGPVGRQRTQEKAQMHAAGGLWKDPRQRAAATSRPI
jgi:hypothetical protein